MTVLNKMAVLSLYVLLQIRRIGERTEMRNRKSCCEGEIYQGTITVKQLDVFDIFLNLEVLLILLTNLTFHAVTFKCFFLY